MKTDRLVGIIMTLLDKKRISAQELAEQFEVSPRTIYRDIDAINLAGIPVRGAPGVKGGFEIMEEYKLHNKVFSAADLSALLMGLSSLSSMVRGDELIQALAKVKSLVPPHRAKEIEARADQIRVDYSPWMGGGGIQQRFEAVKAALRQSKLLSFAYIAHHGKRTVRTVEPYRLVSKGSHWYLQGYCRKRNDFRLFRLSRMFGLQVEEETFLPRACPAPALDFGEALEALETTIQIRVHWSALDRVLDFRPCGEPVPDGGGHYLVSLPFIENDYHYDLLMGLGEGCECLGPPRVRGEMRRRTRRLAALYER